MKPDVQMKTDVQMLNDLVSRVERRREREGGGEWCGGGMEGVREEGKRLYDSELTVATRHLFTVTKIK